MKTFIKRCLTEKNSLSDKSSQIHHRKSAFLYKSMSTICADKVKQLMQKLLGQHINVVAPKMFYVCYHDLIDHYRVFPDQLCM